MNMPIFAEELFCGLYTNLFFDIFWGLKSMLLLSFFKNKWYFVICGLH